LAPDGIHSFSLDVPAGAGRTFGGRNFSLQFRHAISQAIWLITLLSAFTVFAQAESSPWRLWYQQPAEQWVEALPVGNGRLGAMDFGGVLHARFQINEDSLWTSGPHDYARPGAVKHLPEIRRLLFEGKQKEAEELAGHEFMSQPLGQMAYQPLGDVEIEFPGHEKFSDYHRELDLETATATTWYTVNGVEYTRQTFASFPDQAIVIRLDCNQPKKLAFKAKLTSPQTDIEVESPDAKSSMITGRVRDSSNQRAGNPKGQMKFAARLACLESDGQVTSSDSGVEVKDASYATLVLTAATNYKNFRDISGDPVAKSEANLRKLDGKSFKHLHETHVEDHQALFNRVTLDLDGPDDSNMPTDDRVLLAKEKNDPQLAALLFHYGRYLLIASSRVGDQPANLQGIWNDQMSPPWDSKYTTNINAEMNYWPAEVCNLGDCAEPLFAAMEELAQSGAIVAKEHYGAQGWVLHHNFDLWRGTAPINASNHGIWPTGGAWLCQHLWWHYQFTGDKEFLRDRGYPLMKGAAEFFVDTLIEDPRTPEKWLICGPSNSGGLVLGPTMDHQIIRELLANTSAAADELGVDPEFSAELKALHERIAPNKIGKHEQLQEWLEDVDDPNNRHRHVSHLWGLFPGDEINPATPEFFNAARKSLEMRGDGGTGWSLAWKINLWARLRDGDHAHKILDNLLTLTGSPKAKHGGGGVYPNLFDAHPPFQIDGNFGATSGICEMLVQSQLSTDDGTTIVDLLPALPSVWPSGEVGGLRTRDGYDVSLTWENGQLNGCRLNSTLGKPVVVRYGDKERRIELAKGQELSLNAELADVK
jgi:alpha-L-fucosidase 2